MKSFEQIKNPERTFSKFEDLRGLNLLQRDLKDVPIDVLVTADFDTKTVWPSQENCPRVLIQKK